MGRDFAAGSASDGGTGSQNLNAAMLSAGATRAMVINAHVAAFGSGPRAAVIDAAVEYDSGADSGADGRVKHVTVAPSRAPTSFRQSRCISVVVHFYRHLEVLRHPVGQRKVTPTRQIRRIKNYACRRIEWAGRTDADSAHPFASGSVAGE